MIRGSFLARRINSARLLLGTITLTVLITAALGAALASFAAQSLPQAVRAQLIGSPDLSVAVSGSMTASQVGPASRAVRASLGGALSGVPYEIDRALWSDPLGLPAPKGGAAVPIVQVAEVQRIQEHAVLTAGAWPGAPGRGRPIGVALPALAARELHAGPGTILRTSDRITNARVPLLVTGVYRVKDPAAGYWRLDLIATSGVSVQAPFVSYGPAVASPAAFGSGGLAVGKASWIVLPDGTAIGDDRLSPLAAKVSGAAASLQASNNLGGIGVSTGMPRLLDGLATSLVVARSLVVIGALQLLLLAAAALALAARLLARHREEESALLGARGATRWQLARPTLVETLVFGGLAAAAGVLAGTRLAALLVRLTESGRGLNVSGIPASAWWAAAAALVLAAVVVLWPALRPGGAAPRRGRQAALAGLARAGADLVLLALAVVAVWELHTYSAVAHSATGGLGVDPVIAVAPALALAAVTAVSLRLLPAAARLLERVAAQGRRLAAALAGWQISRRPLRQSGPFLLVILATAAATLALAQYQSASGSADDQAAFAVGADLRADVAAPLALPAAGQIARSPGIRAVTPVTTTGAGQVGELIALDAHAAPATVLLRSDLSPVPAPQLWQRLVPARAPGGLAIPGRPASLTMTARLTPGSAALVPGPATVTLSVQDADGIVYLVGAGTLPADGRTHELTASLSPARQAAYPLRLLGLSFDYTLPVYPPSRPTAAYVPPQHGPQARLDLGALTAGPGGQPFATGVALRTWGIGTSATGLSASGQPTTAIAAAADGARPWLTSWKRAGAGQELLFSAGFTPSADSIAENNEVDAGFTGELTIAAGPPAGPVPAIATSSFLRNADGHVGSVLPVPVGGVTILMRVVASVSEFPTIGSGSALIVDQAPVQAILAAHSATPLPVTQWWLATGGTAVPAALRGASVTSRAAQTAALMRNPLSELPRQAALAIGLAAVLLAAIGFSISVAASAAARRGENAVLSALGVARSAQAGQLCLEQLLLSVPAAAGGLLVGSGLARLVVPAITLTATAGRPFPPVLVRVPLGWAALLALVLAALPVLAAAVTTARRPDPAAELRAAEAS
ncbi:MAG TPA: FtsX-like permease family protein [Streptosporangiaceae bacterium]|nr:FtsX-like permease family protein [Streptosporangiaceae bacterium]